jgi:hypothetical protein
MSYLDGTKYFMIVWMRQQSPRSVEAERDNTDKSDARRVTRSGRDGDFPVFAATKIIDGWDVNEGFGH